jgi:hypothetical protein
MGLMLPRLGNSGLAGNVIFFGMCRGEGPRERACARR